MTDEAVAAQVANKLLPPAHWNAGTPVRFIDPGGNRVRGRIVGPSFRMLAQGLHVVRRKDGSCSLISFDELTLDV